MKNKLLLSFSALCGLVAVASSANAAQSTEVFGGFSATESSWYSYAGGVTAVNRDISKDGFLVRASGGYGGYDYDRVGNPAGGVNGTPASGDLMVGYHKFFSGLKTIKGGRLTVYVGGDYQSNHLNKIDTGNPARGGQFGVKGLTDLRLDLTDKIVADITGSYSGAFNTYWSNARVGYNFGNFSFGPEASFLGSKAFDQQRFGAYVGDINLIGNLKATVAGGYENSVRRGDDGAYGDVSVAYIF